MRVPLFLVRLRVAEDHAVMLASEAGHRVHMGVGQHQRARAGDKLPADDRKLLARMKVKMDQAITQEVLYRNDCS